ncbi:MAG: TolC family protein, partial [Acidobacteriota bacterium]|nr:TolC family protein [Acidobacteriota bacterium]
NKQSPTSLFAPETKAQGFSFGLSQLFPTGGTLNLNWANTRQVQSGVNLGNQPGTTAPGGTPNTGSSGKGITYNTTPTFTYTQPLLRNSGRLAIEHNLLVARTNSTLSRTEFERQVIATSIQIIDSYWNLVNAIEQLVVAQEALGLAKDLHDRNRVQVEVGTLAPLSMVQSEAAVKTREEDIITARAAIDDAADLMRILLNLPPGPLWQMEVVPTTAPETDHIEINQDEALETAWKARTEIRESAITNQLARINEVFFKNEVRPQLDLVLGYGYSGSDVNFPDALSQISGLSYPNWTARLNFSYPLQNRTARAQALIGQLEVERTGTDLDQQRKLVTNEVRHAVRLVVTAAKSIDAAKTSRDFQEKTLDAERKRYENGMSTSYQITLIQNDLTLSKSREVNAIVSYRTALAEYYRSIGKLLDVEGVQLIDPPDEVHRFGFGAKAMSVGGKR